MMNKSKVLLDLEEYNVLRDFKKNIEAGYTYVISIGTLNIPTSFIGTDKALEIMNEKLRVIKKELESTKKELAEKKMLIASMEITNANKVENMDKINVLQKIKKLFCK